MPEAHDPFALLRFTSLLRWRAERCDRAGDCDTSALFREAAATIESLDQRVKELEGILRLEEDFDRAITKG